MAMDENCNSFQAYTWGWSEDGQLGHGDTRYAAELLMVLNFYIELFNSP